MEEILNIRYFPLKHGALSIYQEIPEIPIGMLMEHTFSGHSMGKFPGIRGILKRWSCFSVGNFPVKLRARWKACSIYEFSHARNHQFLAIHGDICATICGEESITEWNLGQMEHVLHSMDLSIEVSDFTTILPQIASIIWNTQGIFISTRYRIMLNELIRYFYYLMILISILSNANFYIDLVGSFIVLLFIWIVFIT